MAATLLDSIRKFKPLNEADRLWYDLDNKMNHTEKLYWVKVIAMAAEIEQDMKKSRHSGTEKL